MPYTPDAYAGEPPYRGGAVSPDWDVQGNPPPPVLAAAPPPVLAAAPPPVLAAAPPPVLAAAPPPVLAAAPPPVFAAAPPTITKSFVCLPPQDGKDRNPPVRLNVALDVDRSGDAEHMRVVYNLWNGQQADRAQQYSATMKTSEDRTIYSWQGTSNRDPSETMNAALYYGSDSHWYYREKHFARGIPESDNTAPCEPN
jgi:hypothetical protein